VKFNIPKQEDEASYKMRFPYISGSEAVSVEELPNWIKSGKYIALESGCLVDWYVLFNQRLMALGLLEGGNDIKQVLVDDDLNLELGQDFSSFITTKKKFVEQALIEVNASDYKQECLGVKPLTMLDALVISDSVIGVPDEDLDESYNPDFSFLDSIYDEELIRIDLSKSSRELESEFKQYLNGVKKAGESTALKGGKAEHLVNLINRLKRYWVLQFVDLWLWAKLNNKTLAHKEIFKVISKGGIDIPLGEHGDISAHTIPLVREIFKGKFMNRLRLEAIKSATKT